MTEAFNIKRSLSITVKTIMRIVLKFDTEWTNIGNLQSTPPRPSGGRLKYLNLSCRWPDGGTFPTCIMNEKRLYLYPYKMRDLTLNTKVNYSQCFFFFPPSDGTATGISSLHTFSYSGCEYSQ